MYAGVLLYARRVEPVPKARLPTIPWHYIYNLALKHLTMRASSRDVTRDWSQLAELARDMAATYGVEAYGGFKNLDLIFNGMNRTSSKVQSTPFEKGGYRDIIPCG